MQPFTAVDVCDQCMLQLLFKHRCMLESNARETCAQIYGDPSEETYSSALARVGKLLDELKMKIKTVRHFNDHNTYIALINQAEDEPAKLSSKYSFAEMQFFFALVEHIATQDDAEDGMCSVRMNDALNLNTAGASAMTQEAAAAEAAEPARLNIGGRETAIERLVSDWWLLEDDKGRLSIGDIGDHVKHGEFEKLLGVATDDPNSFMKTKGQEVGKEIMSKLMHSVYEDDGLEPPGDGVATRSLTPKDLVSNAGLGEGTLGRMLAPLVAGIVASIQESGVKDEIVQFAQKRAFKTIEEHSAIISSHGEKCARLTHQPAAVCASPALSYLTSWTRTSSSNIQLGAARESSTGAHRHVNPPPATSLHHR
eukprot:jgi/Ulvmu1/10930/UM007_0109.1